MEKENLTPEEREIRKKRAAKKRKMRLALVVSVFVLFIVALVGGITSLFIFRVKSFDVQSESSMYTHQEVIEASGIELNKSLIFINLDKAEETAERKLPFLKNVRITKKLPDKLVIRFEESGMAYAIETSGNIYAITNDEFKVLSLSGGVPEGIVPVKGQMPVKAEIGETLAFVEKNEKEELAEDKVLNVLNDIASTVSESGLTGITAINVESLTDIYLIYEDRILVEFGDAQNIKAKASMFVRTIEKENAIDSGKTGIMDITIAQSAYIYSSDIRDIPELAAHLGISSGEEPEEDEPEKTEDESENAEEDEEETTEAED